MARQIACGHCGGSHGSIAEVRDCSAGDHQQSGSTPTSNSPSPPETSAPTPNRPAGPSPSSSASRPRPTALTATATATGTVETIDAPADRLAGPPQLGRSLLTGPGDPIPEPWQGLAEIEASADSARSVIERLHEAWRNRERLIIRWSGPLPDGHRPVTKPFYELSVAEELPGDRLLFSITANSVNTLGPKPSYPPLTAALALGATLTMNGVDAGPGRDGAPPGELTLSDGSSGWADGGPLDLTLPGRLPGPLIPRCHLAAGSLRPVAADRRS
ncbi:MAG: hypothetical protein ACR2QK_10110, partial [Acidimicrobiales bacterium]